MENNNKNKNIEPLRLGDFFELVRQRYALLDNGDRKAKKNPTGQCIDCLKPVDRDLGFYRCFDCARTKRWQKQRKEKLLKDLGNKPTPRQRLG